ncbi:PTS system mannose/fructose/sorbose family transporter subunit IID [Pediococcus acidilactici]|uniref:PTS system mannose/fructose/sorbose family transporter subunit IID n=1 Tax=Pediococcus acidilactici TaxID=1254 RepID=UPI0006B40BD3|nr:PTS system mannose/fructose/sorbose family transporter subunit IID [Pediococcus acidilactici]KAF0370987.1 PTS mannose transporter subunit IID [Pediococcus acidilactici]KAF0382228.1 PTS mannose transporter subunit IID [Pediococcus acidilactici]KAF0455749.1 PTS mannose transporter subunit IID [Pediococcus acidilactici]KAF0475544.1 PTS mannose transporter subunit IID [Pediococcus acidilactici]KAF0535524.1 PTS mannose transporter subunit IID [Pediococcus acidilactici]
MNKTVDKKTLRSVFWRSFALQGAFNFEKMQNIGYAYSMIPVIRKLYDKQEDQSKALKRHLALFNSTPAVTPAIMGISAAMEEQKANRPLDFDENSINAVKAALMAPLAGIGDSLFFGTFRVIAAGIGISLAKQGSILGPLLFLILYNVPNFAMRIWGLKYGYKVGIDSLEKLQKNGLMEQIMSIVGMIGMMVVGGMVATMLTVKTPIKFSMAGATVKIQNIIDQIIPNLLPLTVTLLVFWLVRKKVSMSKLTVGVLIAGILAHLIGIL